MSAGKIVIRALCQVLIFELSDIDPSVAKKIAVGDVDPTTHLPMKDINPSFAPRSRVLRELPLAAKTPNRTDKGKGKASGKTPSSGGILDFFGEIFFCVFFLLSWLRLVPFRDTVLCQLGGQSVLELLIRFSSISISHL